MIDIGFSGPRYTWSNRRPLSRLILERIDKVFLNTEWNSLFPEAAVFHLEMTELDHCPVKLCMDNNRTVQFPKPFRFQPMWLSHPSFPGVVRDAWSSQPTLMQAQSSFTAKANAWNKIEFGNLFHRKRRILARLRGIQENLSFRPNDFLVDLERKLQIEYAEVTKLEEEFWAMKARILWLVEGDRNIAFYHTSALVRRRRNRILCMKDRVGNWLHGDRVIADFIRKGFMELFTSDLYSVSLADWNPLFWHTYLNEEETTSIDSVVTEEEITAGMWGLKPFKAPSPDGLHVGFFQRFWLIVGETVKKEVNSIFTTRKVREYRNKTLITLIPKCKNPETLNNYRPSACVTRCIRW